MTDAVCHSVEEIIRINFGTTKKYFVAPDKIVLQESNLNDR